jgi:AcrR family transcriptional regulator
MKSSNHRKTKIIRQAAKIFLENGYTATSMNQIADRCQITKPGLYYHFKSKQELLFSVMSVALDVLEKSTLAATLTARDNEDRLRKIINTHARMVTEESDGAFTILVTQETTALAPDDRRIIDHRMRAHLDLVRATLEELRNEGKLRNVDSAAASFSILGMVVWIARWFRPSGPLDSTEVANEVTDLALAAVLRDDRRS